MPPPGRFARVLLQRHVPLRTRSDLFRTEARRRIRPRPAYPLHYGSGAVYLSDDDYAVDWESFKFVVVDRAYETDYRDTVVLDLGAHKGYFGAYALVHGARAVISFEPEAANVELLERAAATYRRSGADWLVRQVAVGAERGEAELHVMRASWGHALHPPDSFAGDEVAVQVVAVEAMRDVLADAGSVAGMRSRIIVKVNTEGEECGIVLGTPPPAWEVVSELFVEVHPWAACTAEELTRHVAAAGFTEAQSAIAPVIRLLRGERA